MVYQNDLDRQKKLAIHSAAGALQHGNMSRREFLRLCALAGFSAASPFFLGGCQPAPTSDADKLRASMSPTSTSETNDQYAFLRDVGRGFRGMTLHIITEDTPPSRATRELAAQEFVPITGIQIDWEQLPLYRVLAKISADTALHAGNQDVYYIDQSWAARFSEDTISPTELLLHADLAYPDYRFDDILPSLVQHVASYKGQLLGIPYDIPIFIMMYRQDVFKELGLAAPANLAEYLNVCRVINQAKGPRMYGSVAQWQLNHYSLECSFSSWLWSHGGSYFGADQQPALEDDQAVAALEYMLQLGKVMSPAVTTMDWDMEAAAFRAGQAGVYISWGENFPSFDDPAVSRIVGLAQAAPCPHELALRPASACGFDEAPGISHQGGSYLGISRYSKQINAAWVFVQWATSADVTARACLLGGGSSPIRKSNYSDPRVLAQSRVTPGTTRHFDVTLDAIQNKMGTEPHLPDWSNLAVQGISMELSKLLTGQQTVRQTAQQMAAHAREATR